LPRRRMREWRRDVARPPMSAGRESRKGPEGSMNRRTASRLAWGIAILSYAIVAACLVLLWLNRATIGSVGAGPVGSVVPAATLGALGALIASRRPSNPIGWLMLGTAALVGASLLAALITIRALLAGVSPH